MFDNSVINTIDTGWCLCCVFSTQSITYRMTATYIQWLFDVIRIDKSKAMDWNRLVCANELVTFTDWNLHSGRRSFTASVYLLDCIRTS